MLLVAWNNVFTQPFHIELRALYLYAVVYAYIYSNYYYFYTILRFRQ